MDLAPQGHGAEPDFRHCGGLYKKLYRPQPLGLALRDWYLRASPLGAGYDADMRAFNRGDVTVDLMPTLLATLLAARDVESMVILGDPTAMLPDLAE